MAYDETLAERVRNELSPIPGVEEKRMFGGIAFMVQGHMAVGVINEDLMARLGEPGAASAMSEPHVRPMDFTGTPMRTMAYISPEGTESDEDLSGWVARALEYVRSLPPK